MLAADDGEGGVKLLTIDGDLSWFANQVIYEITFLTSSMHCLDNSRDACSIIGVLSLKSEPCLLVGIQIDIYVESAPLTAAGTKRNSTSEPAFGFPCFAKSGSNSSNFSPNSAVLNGTIAASRLIVQSSFFENPFHHLYSLVT